MNCDVKKITNQGFFNVVNDLVNFWENLTYTILTFGHI